MTKYEELKESAEKGCAWLDDPARTPEQVTKGLIRLGEILKEMVKEELRMKKEAGNAKSERK